MMDHPMNLARSAVRAGSILCGVFIFALMLSACSPSTAQQPAGQPSAPTTAPAAGGQPGAQPTMVNLKNTAFDPKTLSVSAGTTVTWTNQDSIIHTVTADDGSFDSKDLAQGAKFTFTFSKPGTYAYYCVYHGAKGGKGMSGTITVK